jgi:hypothetical protein
VIDRIVRNIDLPDISGKATADSFSRCLTSPTLPTTTAQRTSSLFPCRPWLTSLCSECLTSKERRRPDRCQAPRRRRQSAARVRPWASPRAGPFSIFARVNRAYQLSFSFRAKYFLHNIVFRLVTPPPPRLVPHMVVSIQPRRRHDSAATNLSDHSHGDTAGQQQQKHGHHRGCTA